MTLRIIAGAFKGRYLKTPKTQSTRPTQGMLREAVFNICQNRIEEARFLDLYAGSGAMGFEALSRGAKSVVMVEQNKQAYLCIQENAKTLQVEPKIFQMPSQRALQCMAKEGYLFDLIYIDPPYDLPIDLSLVEPLLAPNGWVLVEERFEPKKKKAPIQTSLTLKESRRFGIALLSIYLATGSPAS